jgi:hypothetical protein
MGRNIVRMIIQTREVTIVRLWRSASTITYEEIPAANANELKGGERNGKPGRSLEGSVRLPMLLHLARKLAEAVRDLVMRTM